MMTKTVVIFDETFVLVMMEVAVEVVNEDFILNAALLNYMNMSLPEAHQRWKKLKDTFEILYSSHSVSLHQRACVVHRTCVSVARRKLA